MSDSSPPRAYDGLPSLAGVKRAANAPGLLPAFEPSSSPSRLPPQKRVARESFLPGKPLLPAFAEEHESKSKYPTPVPTSETHILSSSPPGSFTRRPHLSRTLSTLSQRNPLASVPYTQLDPSGEPMLFGRSGKSSHYQLQSVNKNISRVHFRAAYLPADSENLARVEITCMGWNGMKVHCQGKHWELNKEDNFCSESAGQDIMVDVAETRVVVQWPSVGRKANTPETSEDEGICEESPSRRAARLQNIRSPLPVAGRLQSPVSPKQENTPAPSSDPPPIQIYEDHESDEDMNGKSGNVSGAKTSETTTFTESFMTQPGSDVENEENEENDPTVHSFGPMGANLLPQMASFCATSPEQPRRPLGSLKDSSSSPRKRKREDETDDPKHASPARVLDCSSQPLVNHVVNQLAYSRLNQMPLSTIMSNLPSAMKEKGGTKLDYDELRRLVGSAACIGEVRRRGKDAAGVPLESEYYYIADKDLDDARREAVTGTLRKPGLRACRKEHKQYFWRKPK